MSATISRFRRRPTYSDHEIVTPRTDLGAARDGSTPHHQRPSVHQRDQAPGQHGGVHAPGGRVLPVPPPARPRRPLHLRDGRARHPGRAGREGAGLPVAEFCAQAHDAQKAVYDGFELAFDYFGRSSSPQNREITQHFARRLKENGFIEERAIRQVYSPADGRFLPDRYVEGTCPHCGYDKARGDQCENCTRVLDPTDLIDPRSAISG